MFSFYEIKMFLIVFTDTGFSPVPVHTTVSGNDSDLTRTSLGRVTE
jgi:hypothetical protein